jgi:hypothetical protein
MTPKEKAKELYKKMYTQHPNIYPLTAKQCALIAVEEIIKTLYEYHYDSESGAYEYWQEVKQEIEKL